MSDREILSGDDLPTPECEVVWVRTSDCGPYAGLMCKCGWRTDGFDLSDVTDEYAAHRMAPEIDRLTAEVSRLQMECRQWRQAVDMATRRAVAAEERLKGDAE